jgi:hypothetical protein
VPSNPSLYSRQALGTALAKLKVDAKTVQGMLRHEHLGTTLQL